MKRRQFSTKTVDEILDEVYTEMPAYVTTEEDVDGMYKQYEKFLRNEEMSSLDLDYDPE